MIKAGEAVLAERSSASLENERVRLQAKRDYHAGRAMQDEVSAWVAADIDDLLDAIDNELARRAAAEYDAQAQGVA